MFILVSTVTGSVSVSKFASLVCVPAVGIKICLITAGIKKNKLIV